MQTNMQQQPNGGKPFDHRPIYNNLPPSTTSSTVDPSLEVQLHLRRTGELKQIAV